MTQVFTEEQKKISEKIGLMLDGAADMAAQLPMSAETASLISAIHRASCRKAVANSAVIRTILVTQHSCGDWSIMETIGDNEAPGIAGLTGAQVIDRHARMVKAACPEVAEPDADTQQATDAVGCMAACSVHQSDDEWRRSRAMEFAIEATKGQHISAAIEAASQIESFLKGETK